MDEKPERFDWEAPDAFEKWAEEHGADAAALSKMRGLSIEKLALEFPFHVVNFQADRSTAWFLRAVEGMKMMRELADYAIALLPEAERRGTLAGKQAAAEAEAKILDAKARQQAGLRKGPGKAGERGTAEADERRHAVDVAMTKLGIAVPESEKWTNKAIGEALLLGQATYFTFKGKYVSPGKSPFELRGLIEVVGEIRPEHRK